MSFGSKTCLVSKKENFLKNINNKQKMILLIGEQLSKNDCTVVHADGDADVMIMKAAIESSKTAVTTLIGEDTDLLLLLLYHYCPANHNIFFRSDIVLSNSSTYTYDIANFHRCLGQEMCKLLRLVHAFTCCNTTLRIFQPEVAEAGTKAMISLFGDDNKETLHNLRYRMLAEKVTNAASFVKPERLPPTQSATKYHSMHAYYQIAVWISNPDNLKYDDWGWILNDDQHLFPKVSDLPAAPQSLLKVIRCKCIGGCVTMRCSCRKNGLPCSTACGICQQDNCQSLTFFSAKSGNRALNLKGNTKKG